MSEKEPEKTCMVPGCVNCSNAFLVFKAPKESIEKWASAIPNFQNVFNGDLYVCELHFKDKDFFKYKSIELPDGRLIKNNNNLGLALNLSAVPSIFTENENDSSDEKISSPLPDLSEEDSDIVPLEINDDDTNQKASIEFKRSVFKLLVSNVDNVELPSEWWKINTLDSIVICAKWDSNTLNVSRRVIVSENLEPVVYLDKECVNKTSIQFLPILDFHCLSKLLKEIDSYKIMEVSEDQNRLKKTTYLDDLALQKRLNPEPLRFIFDKNTPKYKPKEEGDPITLEEVYDCISELGLSWSLNHLPDYVAVVQWKLKSLGDEWQDYYAAKCLVVLENGLAKGFVEGMQVVHISKVTDDTDFKHLFRYLDCLNVCKGSEKLNKTCRKLVYYQKIFCNECYRLHVRSKQRKRLKDKYFTKMQNLKNLKDNNAIIEATTTKGYKEKLRKNKK